MIGAEGTAELVRSWLAATIPTRLDRIDTSADEDPAPVPRPALVAAEERGPLALEWMPAVLVLPQRTRSMTLVGVLDGAGEVYRVVYTVQVLAWVRAVDHVTASRLQRRYALAIREALLERKQLRPLLPGARSTPSDSTIDPASLVESYSPVMLDEGAAASLAAVTIDVDVIVAEVLDGPPARGTAETLTVAETTDGLPPAAPGPVVEDVDVTTVPLTPAPPRAVSDPLGLSLVIAAPRP